MKDLNALLAQREAISAEIAQYQQRQKTEAVRNIKAMMLQFGVTLADLADRPLYQTSMPPRYRDEHGNTWSGTGRRPTWLKAAMRAGKTMDDLRVRS